MRSISVQPKRHLEDKVNDALKATMGDTSVTLSESFTSLYFTWVLSGVSLVGSSLQPMIEFNMGK